MCGCFIERSDEKILPNQPSNVEEWQEIEVVMDSGSGDSVAPTTMAPGVSVRESVGSKQGQHYVSAIGNRIPNLGEKVLEAATEEGNRHRVTFQVTDVSRPLCAVSKVCQKGNRVIFDEHGGVVQNSDGSRDVLRYEGWHLLAEVVDAEHWAIDECTATGFPVAGLGVEGRSEKSGVDGRSEKSAGRTCSHTTLGTAGRRPVRSQELHAVPRSGNEEGKLEDSREEGKLEEPLEEEAARMAKTRRTPKEPSLEERIAHRLTHLPYRNWCEVCVEARGRNTPHLSKQPRELHHPHVHLDYCFPREEKGGDSVVAVALKDEATKAIVSHVVPHKGDFQRVATQSNRDLLKWGMRGKITMKSDKEPALIDLLNGIARKRIEVNPESVTLIEHPPSYDPQANGMAERAIQSLESMVRTLKLGIEARIRARVQVRHPIFSWMVEHAADLLTKYVVGVDGRTPYERLKGRAYRGELYEFSQPVFRRVNGKVSGGVMKARWAPSIWLGKRFVSDEHTVCLENGTIVRARGIQPMPDTKWSWELIDKVQGTPWSPDGVEYDDECVARVILKPVEEREEAEVLNDSEDAPRGVRMRKEHMDKNGYTDTCPKCRAWLRGGQSRPTLNHSSECRARVVEEMQKDPVLSRIVESAERRKVEWKRRRTEAREQSEPAKPAEPIVVERRYDGQRIRRGKEQKYLILRLGRTSRTGG